MVDLFSRLRVLYPVANSRIDFRLQDNKTGEGPFISYWNPALGPQPTQQQLDAVTQQMVDAAEKQRLYAAAKALITADDPPSKQMKAFVLVCLDEFNAHAAKINAILTAIDNAATLAALKVTIAAINDYPTRTAAQLKTSMANKIDAGDADG